MYKLEGRLASVLAKIEADQSRWLETQQLHDAYRRKEDLGRRVGFSGCALPFLGLFLYGFSFVPYVPWGLVWFFTIAVFLSSLIYSLVNAARRGKTLVTAFDHDLIEGYRQFFSDLTELVAPDVKTNFSVAGHFLRGDNTRASRESLTQESEYPVREEHNFRVLMGEFQLPDGTPASLRIVRRHEAELQRFSENYYVGGKLTSRTVIQANSEQNEDCYELVLPEDFEPKSLPEGVEVHQEKDRTILKSTTSTESMELDLKPALTLLRSAVNSRA